MYEFTWNVYACTPRWQTVVTKRQPFLFLYNLWLSTPIYKVNCYFYFINQMLFKDKAFLLSFSMFRIRTDYMVQSTKESMVNWQGQKVIAASIFPPASCNKSLARKVFHYLSLPWLNILYFNHFNLNGLITQCFFFIFLFLFFLATLCFSGIAIWIARYQIQVGCTIALNPTL